MNYFVGGSTSHRRYCSFESCIYLFPNHQFGFAPRTSAAAHQLHHPLRNYSICFKDPSRRRARSPSITGTQTAGVGG
jgi:hypothetical protein